MQDFEAPFSFWVACKFATEYLPQEKKTVCDSMSVMICSQA